MTDIHDRADEATIRLKSVIGTLDVFAQSPLVGVPDYLGETYVGMERDLREVLEVLVELHNVSLKSRSELKGGVNRASAQSQKALGHNVKQDGAPADLHGLPEGAQAQ